MPNFSTPLKQAGAFLWWVLSLYWGVVAVGFVFLGMGAYYLCQAKPDDALVYIAATYVFVVVATIRQGCPE